LNSWIIYFTFVYQHRNIFIYFWILFTISRWYNNIEWLINYCYVGTRNNVKLKLIGQCHIHVVHLSRWANPEWSEALAMNYYIMMKLIIFAQSLFFLLGLYTTRCHKNAKTHYSYNNFLHGYLLKINSRNANYVWIYLLYNFFF